MSAPQTLRENRQHRRRTSRTTVLVGVVAAATLLLTACDPADLAAYQNRGGSKPTAAGGPTTTHGSPTTTQRPTTTTTPRTTTTVPPTTTTTTTTTKPPVTTTSSSAPTSTPSAPAGALAAGKVPQPGQVGFLGDPSSLTVIDGTGPSPAGTTFTGGVLQVTGTSVVLDHVFVKGGIDYGAGGTLTIRNSIIEGNHNSYSTVGNRNASSHLSISDTTIRYKAGDKSPGANWGNGAIHGDARLTIIRCDISGSPDGIQTGADNNVIEQNYIHGNAVFGTYPNNTHNDGVQSYGGRNVAYRYNRIDIRDDQGRAYDGTHQNGALFIAPDSSSPATGMQIVGNFLAGGGYTLRLGTPMSGAVITGNTFGPNTGGFGNVTTDGGSITTWSGNVDSKGQTVPKP